jgi:exopolyphosphatase/guanosine-5'-triphosphate,3'-diphosphate pyrophosphatase
MTLASPSVVAAREAAPARLGSLSHPRATVARWPYRPLAAIHIGADAVALKIVRPIVTGCYETVYVERAPLAGAESLVSTMRRYLRTCRSHDAIPRVAAGTAFDHLPAAAELTAQAARETATKIELLSSRDEARLVCLGVQGRSPAPERVLLVAMDGGDVELVFAAGAQPVALWRLNLDGAGPWEIAAASAELSDDIAATRLRHAARRVVAEARLGGVPGTVGQVIALSGAGRLVRGMAGPGRSHLTACRLRETNVGLMACWRRDQESGFRSRDIDRLLARALVLEAIIDHLGADGVRASDAGLLDGLLADSNQESPRELQRLS